MIFRLSAILISLFALLSCNNSRDNHSHNEVSIAYLKSLCKGDHHRIVGSYSIRGIVVATDWLGELHNSAIIADETGSLEVAIESHNISNRLPVYSEVTILCDGLMLARIGGKIELGATPTGDFPLDNIDDELIDRNIRIVGVCENFTAPTRQFSDISVADISSIVRFENIRICDEERNLLWCDTEEGEAITTYRTFIDHRGDTFAIRTLATCDYALGKIPQKEITVIGAIDYSDDRPFLRIINRLITEL